MSILNVKINEKTYINIPLPCSLNLDYPYMYLDIQDINFVLDPIQQALTSPGVYTHALEVVSG